MKTNIKKYELNTGDVVLSTKGSIGIVFRSVSFKDGVIKWIKNKDGNVISGYPDKDNHCIDSVRYALNNIWKRRGK